MKRREHRPYVRRRPLVESGSESSRLASLAGRAMVERLEPRQLLFSLTITADQVDASGLGTARAIFGYAIPAITTLQQVGTNTAETVIEDFTEVAPGNIGGNTEFDESFMRMKHNVTPPADVQMLADVDADGDPIEGTERLRVRLANTDEFISFEFDSGEDLAVDNIDRPMTSFSFFADREFGVFGLPYLNLRADVFLQGELVASFEGNDLRDLNTAPIGINGVLEGRGTFTFDSQNPDIGTPFDRVVLTALRGPNDSFILDNIQGTFTPGNFAAIVDARIFGAEVTFRGPVGASVQLLDLYGRDIVQTIRLGLVDDAVFTLVDPDDDGIPNFNDGIGQIIFSNVDTRTSFTMWGGTIEAGDDPNASQNPFNLGNDLFQEGLGDFAFTYERADSLLGIYDAFEEGGFGYGIVTVNNQPQVVGLPPGPGAVIIGSPIVRNLNNYNPAGTDPLTGQVVSNPGAFSRVDQGIFVLDGASMGRINIPGIIHGSSQFTGAVEQLAFGYVPGSITVEGDLGLLAVSGDLGNWSVDPGAANPGGITDETSTESEIFIGRTAREIAVAGRSLANVTILGDLSDPKNRPPLESLQQVENEWVSPFDENSGVDERDLIRAMVQNLLFVPESATLGQEFLFGETFYRNDTILGAEWLGSTATSVLLSGNIGFGDPAVNTVEDGADVFAFAVGDGPVTIEAAIETIVLGINIRIVDEDGRTLAGLDGTIVENDSRLLTFDPPAPGVYYLAVTAPGQVDGDSDNGGSYRLAITGLAPTTLGAFRTGGGVGSSSAALSSGSLNLIAGDAGSIRVGTGIILGDATESTPTTIFNSREADVDEALDYRAGGISIPGTLHDFTLGSDLGLPTAPELIIINIGGDLGRLHTGLSTVVGVAPTEGDINLLSLTVGGRVGVLDVRGGIGVDNDDNNDAALTLVDVGLTLTTGAAGGSGDIGFIRVGQHINGGALSVTTPDGSIIGGFLVSQDSADTGPDIGLVDDAFGLVTRTFNTGRGSDIRFVDFPQIDLESSIDAGLDLLVGQAVEITDDSGGTVRITINGVGPGAVAGFVRFLPIEGSQGVAIAQIEANLSGGRTLNIASFGQQGERDPVSIGTINITDATAVSAVSISGTVAVDVFRIIQTGGAAFNQITQDSPGGDIVAIDVVGLNRIDITRGNLGRTELVEFGPDEIGLELGVAGGLQGDVGGALGINAAAISNPLWNGQLYRPINDFGVANAYLDDIGGPFDGLLAGAVIRNGDVQGVSVSGQIADVILQGAGATLVQLDADDDQITPIGGFDGIVGVIYASIVGNVQVGDGVARSDQSPIATTGIFADDEIRNVNARAGDNAVISGFIIAANQGPVLPLEFGGINNITINGGDFVDVVIGVELLDGFWTSLEFGEGRVITGDINTIRANNGDFFRSEVISLDLNTFELTNGFFDASTISVLDTAQRISATGYRNSTVSGTLFEVAPNVITIGQDLFNFGTQFPDGVVSDLRLDVVGSVRTGITAGTIQRTQIDVDNELELLTVNSSIRASAITAGRAGAITALDTIVASTVAISGPLLSLTAGAAIVNTDIQISGINGRLDLLRAGDRISGSLFSSGPIASVTTLTGDIDLDITTIGPRGTIGTLNAARDLILVTDISAGVNSLIAGRHIGDRGDPGVILIRENLTRVSAPNGQLYSDIRVGGTIGLAGGQGGGGGGTAGVVIGRASNRASNDNLGRGSLMAFDRIGPVTINGDFAGTIHSGSNGIQSVAINNGSLLPEGSIVALDGNVESVVITGGHLMGDIHADFDIVNLQVIASLDGIFGDVGINPSLSPNRAADAFRNELPLGTSISSGVDGPRISAGHDIVSFIVTGGSLFETSVYAGREIVLLSVAGGVFNDNLTSGFASSVAAGDVIRSASFTGDAQDVLFAAGVFDLGLDNALGGVGLNADAVHQGRIVSVTIGGDATNVGATAGMNAGLDGEYLTRDETTALGISSVEVFSVAGDRDNVLVSGDSILNTASGGGDFDTFGTGFAVDDARIVNQGQPGQEIGAGGLTFNHKGRSITAVFTGPGRATWNASNGRIILADSTLASSLILTLNSGSSFKDLNIVSKDDASLGVLDLGAALTGDSSIVIDGNAGTVTLRDVDTTGDIRFGGNVTSFSARDIVAGHIDMQTVGTVSVRDLGDPSPRVRGEASLTALNATSIAASGSVRGLINIQRDLGTLNVSRDIDNALVRVGGNLGGARGAGIAVSARDLNQSRISVRDFLGGVTLSGEMFDSAIMIGADLGADGDFGGVGLNRDLVSTGFASTITIAGDFFQSDIIEGALRGPDGFFGTADDSIAEGRGDIGLISIAGTGVGSSRFSESYRIFSTGELAGVTIGGQTGRDQGNFAIVDASTQPDPIRVVDLKVTQASRIYTAEIRFNQAIDASTLSRALSVREVRGSTGTVEIFLIEGDDYTLAYDASQNRALITFNREITSRDLPRLAGVPGQGIFRFALNADILRGQVAGARLDGNGDGFARDGDDYSQDDIVGDAGDKLIDNTVTIGQLEIDFYQPISLDIILDDNAQPDGVPDANRVFTLRGTIGDHPDHDTGIFRFVNDLDVYTLTLQAGQILRIGPTSGSASLATVIVLDENGNVVTGGGAPTDLLLLPGTPVDDLALSFEQNYLVRQTGTYVLAVGDAFTTIQAPNAVPNVPSGAGLTGDYAIDIEIFDDGNNGFAENVDSGDGDTIVNAPNANAFAGPDGRLGTSDDFSSVVIDDFTFTLSAGNDGRLGTNDDVVSGSNGQGITSTRSRGVLTSTIDSAIGTPGHAGVPGEVFADLDVFHLNSGNRIAKGTVIQITVKLSETGADLGSRIITPNSIDEFGDAVEFGVFDTTNASTLGDATLLFSPTDFTSNGGTPGILAENGANRYGFDENGDFFIQFIAPGDLDGSGGASYAVYLQGAFNTDYSLEIITRGKADLVRRSQNFFIETEGGNIDWLRAGGLIADLTGFDVRVLGLSGTNDQGIPLQRVVLDGILDQLESIYDALGLDVRFSTNPADFEFEEFSTIYLTSTPDPINPIFSVADLFADEDFFRAIGLANPLLTQPFQIAEHSDPFNTDSEDEGVVFMPTFGRLGFTPTEADVADLIDSLTAATAQTVNELLGLRHTSANGIGAALFDVNASDAPQVVPGDGESFSIPTIDRALSDPFDSVTGTDFWLGNQNASQLLEKILSTI